MDGVASPTISDSCLLPEALTLAEVTGLCALSSSPPRHQQSSKNISLICGSASSVTVRLVVSLRLIVSFLVFLLLRDASLDAAAELAKTSLLVVDPEVAVGLELLLQSP